MHCRNRNGVIGHCASAVGRRWRLAWRRRLWRRRWRGGPAFGGWRGGPGFGGGGWHGGGGWYPGLGIVAGVAAGAILGGVLAAPYGYGGYPYGYSVAPGYGYGDAAYYGGGYGGELAAAVIWCNSGGRTVLIWRKFV